jgi:hypothetical protein
MCERTGASYKSVQSGAGRCWAALPEADAALPTTSPARPSTGQRSYQTSRRRSRVPPEDAPQKCRLKTAATDRRKPPAVAPTQRGDRRVCRRPCAGLAPRRSSGKIPRFSRRVGAHSAPAGPARSSATRSQQVRSGGAAFAHRASRPTPGFLDTSEVVVGTRQHPARRDNFDRLEYRRSAKRRRSSRSSHHDDQLDPGET